MPASFQLTFREFLDAMPLPAYLFDPECRKFVAANLSFCNLVRYPEPELIALEWPLIMADQVETSRADQEISAREEDVFRTNDFAFRAKDGTRVNTHIQYRVMRVTDHYATRQVYFAAVVSAATELPERSLRGVVVDPSSSASAGHLLPAA
jgi:PAS domain-containing protein